MVLTSAYYGVSGGNVNTRSFIGGITAMTCCDNVSLANYRSPADKIIAQNNGSLLRELLDIGH